jgi:hypothetical protein
MGYINWLPKSFFIIKGIEYKAVYVGLYRDCSECDLYIYKDTKDSHCGYCNTHLTNGMGHKAIIKKRWR